MTVDLSLTPINDWATYCPAISSSYCQWVSQFEKKLTQTDSDGNVKFPNRKPKKISKDAKELFFLDPNNGAFHYNAGLYSAGHSEIDDLDSAEVKEKLIRSRDKNKTTIIADSGGFQIASGASGSSVAKFNWDDIYSKENDKIRLNILRWMESVADYSMCLDIPPMAIENPRTPINSFKDCLDVSKYNAEFFIKNRVPGATKILNTLQGRTKDESDMWWDEFKDFPFEGWAIGGVQKYNMELLLRRLIIMRDGGYLGGDRDWLHILGVSRLSVSCILTEIQRSIRRTIAPTFTISYDSASPFVSASKGMVYTQNVFEGNRKNERFSYLNDKMIETVEMVGSEKPFPFSSVPGRFLTVGDICTRDPAISGTATTWDSFSYIFLMWHNLYRQIDAVQEALRIYDMPSNQIRGLIPANILEFKELCPEIFNSETPFELIEQNKKLLHKLTGVNGEKQIRILDSSAAGDSDIFTWSKGGAALIYDDEPYEISEGREADLISIENF